MGMSLAWTHPGWFYINHLLKTPVIPFLTLTKIVLPDLNLEKMKSGLITSIVI